MSESCAVAASVLPSGLNATATTMSLCPATRTAGLRVSTSQMMTVPSLAPEASVFPSRLKARHESVPLCPRRVTVGSSAPPAHGSKTDNVTRTEGATGRVMGMSTSGGLCRQRGAPHPLLHRQHLAVVPHAEQAQGGRVD